MLIAVMFYVFYLECTFVANLHGKFDTHDFIRKSADVVAGEACLALLV